MITHEERRAVLMLQHQRLRDQMAVLRGAADRLLALPEGDADATKLQALVGEFRAELEAHLQTEETLLGPVLERLDAWGPVRLDLMKAEHAHQRAVLEVLRGATATPHLFAMRTLELLDDVLTDMITEERDLLDPRVLRDDVITLDASDA